jgi:hypothetical protein
MDASRSPSPEGLYSSQLPAWFPCHHKHQGCGNTSSLRFTMTLREKLEGAKNVENGVKMLRQHALDNGSPKLSSRVAHG